MEVGSHLVIDYQSYIYLHWKKSFVIGFDDVDMEKAFKLGRKTVSKRAQKETEQ